MTPKVRRLAVFLPYLALTAWHLVALAIGNTGAGRATKWLLMIALLAAFLAAVPWRRLDGPRGRALVAAVIAGIVLSWVGDVALMFPGQGWFLAGLGGFLLAHLSYLIAFSRVPAGARSRRRPHPAAIAAYAAWFLIFLALLGPSVGALLIPVALYGIALGAMAAVASGINVPAAIGGALFVVSDSILGVNRFLTEVNIPQVGFLIMLTYTLAQLGIVLGALRVLRAARAEGPPEIEASPRGERP